MSNMKLITFLDAAQRTIIGEEVSSTEHEIQIKNPVVVNITPQTDAGGRPTMSMALQLLPLYFKEFQGEKKNPTIFHYNRNQITYISFEGGFDFRLYGQYENIFSTNKASPKQEDTGGSSAETPVLKLFDD